ncbi:MAG: hypothetical protein ACI8YQ_004090 [Polaribacter sp.]|jgi:hypothetical protein
MEPTLTETEEGDYYVVVTDANGCVSTSNTITVMSVSLSMLEKYGVTVSPNPTSQELRIETNGVIIRSELFDLFGARVLSDLKATNDLSHLENGIYLLRLQIAEDIFVVKVQKND